MSNLETVIENYYEHIFAKNVLEYLVDRVNKFIAFMISNGIEQDRYLISVEPKFLNNGLAFLVPFATRLGQGGQRQESAIVFEVKQLSHRRVKVDCRYSNEKWLTPHVLQLWEKMLEYYEMSNERVKEPVGVNQSAAQVGAVKDAKQYRKSGRPHLPEDVWAWEQVNMYNRQRTEVYKEWHERNDVRARNLQDPERQFNRITKPEWKRE